MSAQVGDLARHTGMYGIGTIVGGLSRAALVPIIARYLPAEEYGKASVVFIFISLLAIVSELGLSSGLIKFVSEAQSDAERRAVVSTAIRGSLVFCIPIGVLCVVLKDSLSGILLGSPQYGSLVVIGVAGGLGNAVLQIGLAFERALARSSRYVFYTLLKGGLALSLSAVLVMALKEGALGLIVGSAVPPAVIGLIIYGRLLGRCGAAIGGRLLRSLLDFGVPLVPMNLAMWVLAYSDVYLLRRLVPGGSGLSEVGLYQYAHEICLLMVLPITSFNLAWPQFIFANHSRPGAAEMFARVHRYLAFGLTALALLISVFACDIIRLVGSPRYMGSAEVIPLLAGSLVFYGFSIAFASGLYITGRTRTLAGVVGACALLNVVMNIAVIPHWGKIGAAGATLLTNAVMAAAVLRFAQARYRIPFSLGRSFSGLALAAAVFAGLPPAARIVPIPGVLVRLAGSLGCCMLLMVIAGIRPRDLMRAAASAGSLFRAGQATRNP
jgi:O-antigen/teichoic acid export membrane protein